MKKYLEMDEEVETPMTEEIVEPSVESKTEEKGYLARDEYTSERFKLELSNLPRYFGFGVSQIKFCISFKNLFFFSGFKKET